MTDPFDPEDSAPLDRAEAALRRALHAQAAKATTVAPDVQRVRRAARRRSVWRSAGIAAAVLAVVAGTTVVVRATTGGTDNETAGPTMNYSALAATAPHGWRWEYYRDIEIAVPSHWRYAVEPASDWCVTGTPTHPYVAHELPARSVLLVGCENSMGKMTSRPPPSQWVPHLMLSEQSPTDHAGTTRVGQWTVTRRLLGDALISVVSGDPRLGKSILATARLISRTPQGCATTSTIQEQRFQDPSPPFDVRTLHGISRIVLCQYDLDTAPPKPGLVAQAVLSGAAAERELAALQAAPAGGGPDRPLTCVHTKIGDSATVLHLIRGHDAYTMYAYYDSCRGNGTRDGTTIRALTSRSCPPLVKTPPISLGGTLDYTVSRIC